MEQNPNATKKYATERSIPAPSNKIKKVLKN